ncbi:Transcriptional regulatory protein, ArsR family [Methylophaga frappieri]|uniref:Transcriptional regulatory protein, ArsR family n=1 Tax=Methylophaga frappieri (strain ATCC BAA-2434 / DSM 25690 / JAM7) TaxID=754477 RepID=I1YJF2_METFJ|nr:metalloregulator ArsR/SmtB family transcription factor [Methylophaga frappieri]AFJ03045.1 Transcriptional regulatory protein, ArsR family [Methylophaga frappieri]
MQNQYVLSQYTEAAALFHALSDAGRLRTLAILAEQSSSVSHLAEVTGERIGTVSARLKVLLQANLVTRRREGQSAIYSIADQHVLELIHNALEHVNE